MNENGGKSSTILLTVIGIATLLVVVVGATFAYFAAQVTGNENVSSLNVTAAANGTRTEAFTGTGITVEDKMYPRTEEWATLPVTLTLSGANTDAQGTRTYKFTITGTNNFPTDASIKQLDGTTATVNLHDYIKYEVFANEGLDGATIKSGKQILTATPTEIVSVDVANNANTTIKFDVKLYFVEDKDKNQNDNATHTAAFFVSYDSVDKAA